MSSQLECDLTDIIREYEETYCEPSQTCLCRVARTREGGVEIISESCELHGSGLQADKLLSALPFKHEHDKWREYEDAAERMTRPRRPVFARYELETVDVELLYGGRYEKRARA